MGMGSRRKKSFTYLSNSPVTGNNFATQQEAKPGQGSWKILKRFALERDHDGLVDGRFAPSSDREHRIGFSLDRQRPPPLS